MSDIELAKRLKLGREFRVATANLRKRVLTAAKFMGVSISTKKDGKEFLVQFIKV